MKFLLKQGDLVQVIAGKDKGKTGKILRIEKKKNRVFVEGASIQQKHQKPTQQGVKGRLLKKKALSIILMFYYILINQKKEREFVLLVKVKIRKEFLFQKNLLLKK